MSALETQAHGYEELVAVMKDRYDATPEHRDPIVILWAEAWLADRIGHEAAAEQRVALNYRREREGLTPAIAAGRC